MFKTLDDYPKYKINESGIIVNKKNHIIKPAQSNSGYLRVALEKYDENGKLISRANESVHRLVAKTFIQNQEDFQVVMHLDNDKMNNHVTNLKWGTQQDNVQQAIDDGLFPSQKNWRTVYEIFNNNHIIRCVGWTGLSYKTGYTQNSISSYINSDNEMIGGNYPGYKIRSTDERIKITQPISFNGSVGCTLSYTSNDYPLTRE